MATTHLKRNPSRSGLKKKFVGFKNFLADRKSKSSLSRTTSMPALNFTPTEEGWKIGTKNTAIVTKSKRKSLIQFGKDADDEPVDLLSYRQCSDYVFPENKSLSSLFSSSTQSLQTYQDHQLRNDENKNRISPSLKYLPRYQEDHYDASSSHASSSIPDDDEWSDNTSMNSLASTNYNDIVKARKVSSDQLVKPSNVIAPDINDNYLTNPDGERKFEKCTNKSVSSRPPQNKAKLKRPKKYRAPVPPTGADTKRISEDILNESKQEKGDIPRVVLRNRSFSNSRGRSLLDKKRRLSAESKDIFAELALSKEQLSYLIELEVETVLINKTYNQESCLQWCKEISTKVRDEIRHKIEKSYKIVVSTFIGPCVESNTETVHVSMMGIVDPEKDKFLTVAFEGCNFFIWVTLCLLEL